MVPRDPVRWPPSSMAVAKRTALRIQCDEECAPLTPSLEGRRLPVDALAAEIRADAAEPGGDGDAVPAGPPTPPRRRR